MKVSSSWNKPRYDSGGGNVLSVGVSVRFSGPLFNRGNVEAAIQAATKETLEFGKGVIKEKTPVDTGLLQSQWFYRTGAKKIFNETHYSIFVEWGTYKMAPRAMARKSVPEIGDHYSEQLSEKLRDRLT